MEIQNVISAHRSELLQLTNVVGVGVGERAGQTVIKVLVSRKVSSAELEPDQRVPKHLGDFLCDVEEIGVVQAGAVQTQVLP
ncbi:hypothetical protein BH24DEI2_BH24DEI2_08600 [soil metagenome]